MSPLFSNSGNFSGSMAFYHVSVYLSVKILTRKSDQIMESPNNIQGIAYDTFPLYERYIHH